MSTMSPTATVTPQILGDALAELQDRPPLVQCLTNIVVAGWTANVLLAVGAAPAMVDNPHEAGEFAAIAGAVLVNLGTPYDDTAHAMHLAVAGAKPAGTPWVLDPVAAGALGWRTSLAQQLLGEARPSIVRGNASEILALAGGAGGRGVESVDSPEAAAEVARDLAEQQQSVIAVSGPIDHITDGERMVRLSNGHPWLTQVTGVGCALGALMAAFAAVVPDALVAAAAATATLTVAADSAAKQSRGPGTFAVALLDELALIEPAELAAQVRIS
ncbi:MAG: hydroxyethylthiazole kinase [Dermatophilaceae bacterium]